MEQENSDIELIQWATDARELSPLFDHLKRPPLPLIQDIKLMQIDINYVLVTQGSLKRPVLKLYGISEQGCTVMAHIHGFRPYFYAQPNVGVLMVQQSRQTVQRKLSQFLGDRVEVELVLKQSVRFYKGDSSVKKPFLKVFTSTPSQIPSLRKIIEYNKLPELAPITYESTIPFVLRFMIDFGIVGMGWIQLKNFKTRSYANCKSWCRMQVDVDVGHIYPIKPQGQWAKLAPMRIFSFDIQCDCKQGFPQDDRDSIITIACACKEEGSRNTTQVVLTLDSCSKIPGVQIIQCKTERQLLLLFQDLVCAYDPDFILGYNMINFDLPYIMGRAHAQGLKNYGEFSRVRGLYSKVKSGKYLSKAMGMRQTKDMDMQGRVQLDLMIHMHKDHKLSSYSLNNVSKQFLKQKKQDVHHSEIHKLFKGTPDDRKRLAVYCLKDAELPLRLMEKLMCLYNYAEMARVTGVPINYLFTRGQQIKVASQLYRKAIQQNIVIPCERVNSSGGVMFEGAQVLQPVQGFYRKPIATLDFASLYPSIMMAHNLCYTTLLPKGSKEIYVSMGLSQSDYFQTPQGNLFVKQHKRKGLLPIILQQLIAARKKAKKQLQIATDPSIRAVLDGRQLALKVSANSVYGFTGATVGQLPCLQISSSVTAIGREMILKTKEQVERRFGASVIYGDTDSVMCNFKVDRIQDAMVLGKQAAQQISMIFKSPIKLQFQKVYCPYLLIAKKRYAGLLYTKPEKHDKIDTKGIENVRRDNCPLIRQMLQKVLQMILVDKNQAGAVSLVQNKISDLLMNKIDISQLIITKAITKKQEDEDEQQDNKKSKNTYKVKQAHVELAQKMKKRKGGEQVHIGDRIPYVIIQGTKGSKTYQNAEDPIVVLNQNKPIDYDYYINKQLRGPLQRIFLHIIKNTQELFVGDHTKSRYVPKPSKTSFMGKFVAQGGSCLACGGKVQKDNKICKVCRTQQRYLEQLIRRQQQVRGIQRQFSQLWSQCQRCQRSYLQDVICSNRDCQIYYRRIKIRNELEQRMEGMVKLQQCLQLQW